MQDRGLFLLSVLVAVASAQQGQAPSHPECINLLYQGLTRLWVLPRRVMRMEDLDFTEPTTCEAISLLLETMLGEYMHHDMTGCNWGMPAAVFKAR